MKTFKFSPQTQQTFNRFFANLTDILHTAFNPAAVRQGWHDSGLHDAVTGYSLDRIMTGWNPGSKLEHANWNTIGDAAREQIRGVIPKLAEIGMRRGEISDPEIEGCMCPNGQTLKQLMLDSLHAGYPEWMKFQPYEGETLNIGVGINRRRCILVSNLDWLTAAQLGRRMAGRGLDHAKSVVPTLCAFCTVCSHTSSGASAASRASTQRSTRITFWRL